MDCNIAGRLRGDWIQVRLKIMEFTMDSLLLNVDFACGNCPSSVPLLAADKSYSYN